MQILFVTPSLSIHTGGPAVVVPEVGRALERRGVGVTILATDERHVPSYRQREKVRAEDVMPAAAGLDIRLYPVREPARIAYSPRLAREARALAGGSDLVHVHGLFLHPHYAGWRAARRAGRPLVISPHGALNPYLLQSSVSAGKQASRAFFQNRALRQAAAIHVGAEEELPLIADVAPAVPRFVVPNGVDAKAFAELPSATPFRRRHLGGFGGPVVLYMGRIAEGKRIDLLIDACARRLHSGTDLRLVIAGPDEVGLGGPLRHRAVEAGLGAKVVFTGALLGEEKLQALAAADVWALTSRSESSPVGVLEALASGLPCLLSNHVFTGAELQEEGAALLADLDADDIAAALGALLASPARRARMSDVARRIAARYDWEEIASLWLQMYDRTITASQS